jgi:catechol-2,3-dioxygenase
MHTKLSITPSLPVYDMERASRFYEEKLGFRFEREDDDLRFLRSGDDYLILQKTEAPRGGTTALMFMADDFDAVVDDFRKMDLKFEEYPDMPGVTWRDGVAEMATSRCFWFKDPEGNILNIHDGKRMDKSMRKAA